MLTVYIAAAMKPAVYDKLEPGETPEAPGVWATGSTVDATRDELQSVLEDWILVGVRLGHRLPVVDGIDLNVRNVA